MHLRESTIYTVGRSVARSSNDCYIPSAWKSGPRVINDHRLVFFCLAKKPRRLLLENRFHHSDISASDSSDADGACDLFEIVRRLSLNSRDTVVENS